MILGKKQLHHRNAMKILLLFTFVAAATAAAIGSERCTWGPAYWCDHPLKAKECGEGATQYCIENDWANLVVKDEAMCEDCKGLISDFKSALNNGEVQDDITRVLRDLCDKLGSKATTCKLIVDLYGKDLLEKLVTKLDPSKVCTLVDLCKEATPTKNMAALTLLPQFQADPCADCKQIFAHLKDILSNKTVQQFIFNELITVCNQDFGLPKSECKMIIDEYFPMVFQNLIRYLDGDEICKALGICTGFNKFAFLRKVAKVKVDPCTDCKQIFADLKDILSDATIQQFLAKEIKQECTDAGLPASICDEVGSYVPMVLNYIAGMLDGDEICHALGICNSGKPFDVHQFVLKGIQVNKVSSDLCSDCKQAIGDIKDMLSNKTLKEYIFNLAIDVCQLAGLSESICKSYVDQYGQEIFSELLQFLDPNAICQTLGVCTDSLLNLPVLIQKKDVQVTGDICKECKEALDDLDDILMNTTIQNKIIKTLEKVCETLGVSAASCKVIGQYGPVVLNGIAQELNGETICPEQHFCGSSAVKLHHAVSLLKQIVKATGDPCAECKQMFADITDILNNQKAQQTIFKELIAVCEALGFSSSSCTSDINNYGPLIIGFITGSLTPSTCSSLQFCPAMTTYIQPETPSYLVNDVQVTGDICKECKEALDDLDDILLNTTTQNKIIKTLEKVCETLGVSAASCKVIGQYGPVVLNAIAQELNGETVCPEQHFCGSSAVKLHHAVSLLKQIVKATGDPCAECKQMFADITDILNNQKAQQTIFKELIAVCEALGFSSSSCTSDINNYGPLIIGFITGSLTPSTCSSLQFCPAMTTYIQPETPSYLVNDVQVTGDICKECKEALDDLDDILMNTTIQNKIIKTLEKVCETLGVSAGSCKLIGQYGPVVLNTIAQELNGETVCPEQHFCGSSAVKLHHAVSLLKQIVKATGDPCAECKQMFADITDILNNQKAQQTIFKELIAVCEALGISSSSCTSNINNYGPLIIGFITGELTPATCSSLMLCPAMTTYIQPETPSYLVNVPNAPGDLCKECKEAMTDLKNILNNSTEQKNILNTIEKVCEALGIAPDSCQGAISQFGNLILNAIVSALDPNTICNGGGLCSAGNHLKQVVTILKQLANAKGDMCVECKQMMTDFANLLGTPSVQQDIFKELIAVCEALGISSSSCTSNIDNYGPLIIGFITGYLTPSTCSSLQLCPKMMTYIKPEPVSLAIKANGEDICTDCKQIVAELLDILTNGTIQNRIFHEIIAICTDLGIDPNKCSDTIAHYGPIVMNAITDNLTPSLCNDVKLCSSRVPTEIMAAHLTPARPVLDFGIEAGVGDLQTCVICQTLMAGLQSLYPFGANATQYKKSMERYCSYIPDAKSKKICTDFVSKYGDAVIKAIKVLNCAESHDFTKVCLYIKVCPWQDFGIEASVGDLQTCVMCQSLMDGLQILYPKGASATQLKKTMETVCSYIPDAKVKKLCTDFVSKYGDAVIKALETHNYDYGKVCAYIKVCPGQDFGIEASVGDLQTCVMCQSLMDGLQILYPKGASATQLKKTMETVCSYIPDAKVKKLCTDFVSKYGDAVIKALETHNYDYGKVCAYIKVCPGQDFGIEASEVIVGDFKTCVICQILIDTLQSIYPKGASATQLKQTMETICSYIPDAQPKKLCTDFVSKYGDAAIKALEALNYDYAKVCAYIKVCPDQELNQEKVPGSSDDLYDCVQCYLIKKYLVEVIKPGVTKAQVNAALDAVCILIAYNEAECRIFMVKYRANFTQYILSGKPVDKVCKALHICNNSADEPVPLPAGNQVDVSTGTSVECVLCEFIMKEVTGILKKNGTKKDIIDALEKVCSILPSDLKKECDDFISKNINIIVELILAIGPDGVCQALKVCPGDAALPVAVSAPQKVKIGSSIECKVCEKIVQEIDNLLKKNGTKEEIKKFLDIICKFLPNEEKCEEFVTQYTEVILDLIEALPPKAICQMLKACAASSKALPIAVSAPQKVKIGSSTECEICEYIVKELAVLLKKNGTKEDIENFFDNICKLFPNKTKCEEFVAQYTEEILDLIEAIPPEEICAILKVCAASSKAEVQAPQKVKSGSFIECEICEFILKKLDAFLKKNSTKEDIENFLYKICKLFTSEYEQTCDAFVAAYTEAILNFLVVAPPEEICQILKVCASSSKSVVAPKLPIPHILGGPACGPCEMVIGQVQSILKEPSTEKEIENFLKTKVCSLMKGEGKTACITFVDKYLPEIIQAIASMTPDEVCGLLGLCGSDNTKNMVSSAINSTAECMICELIIKEIRMGLAQNATQAEIQKFLDMVCSKIPLSSLSKVCQDFVNDYTKPIIQYLLAEMDPDKICDFLKVCTPSINKNFVVGKVNGNALCLVCDVLVDMLEKQLESNKSLDEVTKLIENICTLFPSPLNDQCRAFLDIYGPVLLKLLINSKLTPNDVCKDLRLCTSATVQDSRLKNSDTCAECKIAVSIAEDYIKSHKDQILDEIAKLCDLLPKADQKECKNVIEVYGAYAFDLILSELPSADALCKDLGLCNSTVLGRPSNKCHIGPMFWCTSMDNAKLCNAVEHCRRHAWN